MTYVLLVFFRFSIISDLFMVILIMSNIIGSLEAFNFYSYSKVTANKKAINLKGL
jgi:hypothetical protein